MQTAARWTGVAWAALAGGLAQAQTTERVSVATGGTQGTGESHYAAVSGDGRFVAFHSRASNLAAGDTNATWDVFVHDRLNGTTELVSVALGGAAGSGASVSPSISPDGRFVSFASHAQDLVAGDTTSNYDLFVRDRLLGTTERVSLSTGGAQSNSDSMRSSISADGRCVAFESESSNLVGGDTNSQSDVFVHDRLLGTTERVSVSSGGAQGGSHSSAPSISADGRCVAFESDAANLVSGDTNGSYDIFVRDLQLGTTERVSLNSAGAQSNGDSEQPSISTDGRFVAFESSGSNLAANDTNFFRDVFVRDRAAATTECASVSAAGVSGNFDSNFASISADGRCVAFTSGASDLVGADLNSWFDIFVRDRSAWTTELASLATGGGAGDLHSRFATISADGRWVGFASIATNLVAGDTNGVSDVFEHDRGAPGPGTDLCQAGVGGVVACPCANPPVGPPRGCDNSSATGGAQLSSSGTAALGADSLVFVTNGEKPSATSIVLQGSAGLANGSVFGQGVRCAGGALKRLYVKNASGGSIQVPAAGDPSVSARSAALGDPIVAGSDRWYAVYYRDPIVLGGCSAASTFNITQTQLVNWGN